MGRSIYRYRIGGLFSVGCPFIDIDGGWVVSVGCPMGVDSVFSVVCPFIDRYLRVGGLSVWVTWTITQTQTVYCLSQ